MKRTHSESENDDIYSADEKEGEEGCGGISRKRRRGIIEKRRRDRINNSLSELRRLVPAAFEKQGSAKLEKAEILQMTVDHLKMLHTKGLDALAYDPNKFAMDYHNIGFRECAAEVARYMVAVEGLDLQDPLRLRLMSHLQCYSAQREIASKQAASTWGWGSTSASPSPSGTSATYHTSNPPLTGFQAQMLPTHPGVHHHAASAPPPVLPQHAHSIGLDQNHGVSAFSAPTSSHNDISTSSCNLIGGPVSVPMTSAAGSMTTSSSQAHANYHLNLNAHAFPVNHHVSPTHHLTTPIPSSLSHTSHLSSNVSPNLSLASHPSGVNHAYGTGLQGPSGVKPYRPWGAEIAY